MLNQRQFLGIGAASAAMLGQPPNALAQTSLALARSSCGSPSQRKFDTSSRRMKTIEPYWIIRLPRQCRGLIFR
jgi:hypothetical protein